MHSSPTHPRGMLLPPATGVSCRTCRSESNLASSSQARARPSPHHTRFIQWAPRLQPLECQIRHGPPAPANNGRDSSRPAGKSSQSPSSKHTESMSTPRAPSSINQCENELSIRGGDGMPGDLTLGVRGGAVEPALDPLAERALSPRGDPTGRTVARGPLGRWAEGHLGPSPRP